MNNRSSKGIKSTGREVFVGQMAELMPRFLNSLLERERDDLTCGELTFPQYNVLLSLYGAGKLSMHAIAGQLKMKPSNLTGIMNRLVATGLVYRFNSADDRRMVMAEITTQGNEAVTRIMDRKRRTVSRVYDYLAPEERGIYLRIMRRILDALESMSDRAQDGDAPL